MKKILIVVSNLDMGGFSKSLINFLWCMNQEYPEYKISLMILNELSNTLEKEIPANIEIMHISCQYEDVDKKGILLRKYKLKYLLFEMLYKYIKCQDIPIRIVREYAQAKLSHKANCVSNDFTFLRNYDVVISWEEEFCNYVLAEKISNVYKIGYIHPNYIEAGFSKRVDNRYLNELDRIVTISESCCETLKQVFPKYEEKICCIPNCLNLAYYKEMAEKYCPNLDRKTINLLTVARVVDQARAVFRMADIVERLKEDGFDFRWYLIGNGQDYIRLQEVITEKGLEQHLICLGEMDNPCPYMKHADLYVQPSYYEGKPVSVDEAMMLGTPALVTNYSSAKEQVTDSVDGWIVNNNEECIYMKIKELLQKPDLIEKAHQYLKQKDNSKFENCDAMINMLESLEK